jgi:hypothetical protein
MSAFQRHGERIVIAEPLHAVRITDLLRGSYANSPDFDVTDEAHFAVSFSGSTLVMAVLDQETVISTMQMALAKGPSDLDHAYEIDLTVSEFPGLYLRRAATANEKRFSNLNSLLRLYVIEASMAVGIQSLFGLVFQDGPRVRTMEALGYQLTPVSADREAFLKYRTHCLFAHFNVVADGQRAADLLRKRAEGLVRRFTWDNRILIEALAAWVDLPAPMRLPLRAVSNE